MTQAFQIWQQSTFQPTVKHIRLGYGPVSHSAIQSPESRRPRSIAVDTRLEHKLYQPGFHIEPVSQWQDECDHLFIETDRSVWGGVDRQLDSRIIPTDGVG